MHLYALLLVITGIIPLALSFDKRMAFYRQWKYLLPAISIVAMVFIAFDVFFTEKGYWGFNDRYISDITVFNLPLEECLFFFIVPYASIFLHEAIQEYFPNVKLTKRTTHFVLSFLIVISWLLILFNTSKAYTFYIFTKLILILMLALVLRSKSTQGFLVTFLVILIPFLLINGVLTGMFIPDEIVWYNNSENLGIRLFTIPLEDIAYAFSMIFLSVLMVEQLKKLY